MKVQSGRSQGSVIGENLRLGAREAAFYDQNHFEIFHPWEQLRLQREVKRWKGARSILDVATGTGNIISKFEPTRLRVALDLSNEMLERARAKDPRLLFVRADASSLPFRTQTFDLVITYSALHHMSDVASTVKELQRVVAPGGFLVLDHEEAFQAPGWRLFVYGKLRRLLRGLAKLLYWWRSEAHAWQLYRRTPWPFSPILGDIDFQVTEGGTVDPSMIEEVLREDGMVATRHHYLLESLPMVSNWQRMTDWLCRNSSMGHFAVEARRPDVFNA